MEDIPQPSRNSYSVGDWVQVYLSTDDPDSRFHGLVCEVNEVFIDDLNKETGRDTDAYSYTLRNVETDKELPISFRHHDLVPVEKSQ